MRICEEKETDTAEVKGGDCFKDIESGEYYLACKSGKNFALYCLTDGNIYSYDSLFGADEDIFVKVNGCFKVES